MTMTTLPQDTLLVIDDTPDNVNFLLKFLTANGFKVLIAEDGEDGIETANYTLPNLILLDIMMPDMNGFEVCQHLKSEEKTRNIPIIFMTALANTADKVKGFELGAADYITKPIQHEELLSRVNAHLNLHKLQLQLTQRNQQLQAQTEQLQQEIQNRQKAEESLQDSNHALAEKTIELQDCIEELEQRNLELDAFARTVAHDLKNPLSNLNSLIELVMREFSQEQMDFNSIGIWLDLIEKSGDKMFRIVDALLLLARMSKTTDLEIEPLDMSLIVEQTLQRLSTMHDEHQTQIDLPKTWPIAKGYAPWIEEVWANYLSNGIKYGGESPHLELGADNPDAGMIRFWVRDQGKGLSEKQQEQLFTPFTRLHRESLDGIGLGLSIVRQIVEKLGGQVGVDSQIGQGSLFYFTLPSK